MEQRGRGSRQQAADRSVQRRDYIRKKRQRERRQKKIIKAAKKTVKEVLLPAGLGIASGLALICAFIFDPGYQVPEYEEPMIQAQGGEYWYPADEYDSYLQEKAEYDRAQREENEAFLLAIREAQERYQEEQRRAWEEYRSESSGSTTTLIASRDWGADESYIMAKMAMAEAEGEDTEGKALVMLVILNRVWSDGFPDSIEEVITQPGAFTSYSNGRYDSVEPDADCWAAMKLITYGQWDESQGALYFERATDAPTWHSEHLQKLFTHGNHTFYKEAE